MTRLKRKLVLHVGLPKTGTTALQAWCHQHRDELKKDGITYPAVVDGVWPPKHQFVVNGLSGNVLTELRAVLSGAGDCETILLSAEGMSNHLYDFRPAPLSQFRELTADLDVHVFLVSRQRDPWVRSYYKQCVINPPHPEFAYGIEMDLESFARLRRIRRLMDLESLKQDLAAAYGAGVVKATEYEGDWMGELLSLLGVTPKAPVRLDPFNESVSDCLIEPIRQLNGMGLSREARNAWLAVIQHCFPTNHNMLRIQGDSTDYNALRDLIDPRLMARFTASSAEEHRVLKQLSECVSDLLNSPRAPVDAPE